MFEYFRNRKARKAREARERAETATSTYLAGTGNPNPYGYDGFGAPLSVAAYSTVQNDEPARDSDPYNIEERDSLRDEHMTTSDSADSGSSYNDSSSSSSDYSSSYDSSSYDSGSSSSYDAGSSY